MKTGKKDRQNNARCYYRAFFDGNCNSTSMVVERRKGRNPDADKCRLWAVPSSLAFSAAPVILAESTAGIEGCFMEMLSAIRDIPQKSYYEDDFLEWLKKEYMFTISYRDGLVFILSKV